MGTARIFNQDITIAGWEISENTDTQTLTLSKGKGAKKIEYQVTIPQSDKNEEEQQLLLDVLRRIEIQSAEAEEKFKASHSFPGLNALNFGVTRQIAFQINFGNDISYHSPQALDTGPQPPYLTHNGYRYYRTPTEKLLQIQIQDRSEDDYNTLINDWTPETTPSEIIDITHDSTLTQQFQDPDNPEQNIDGGKIASDFGIPYQRDLIINIFDNLDDKNKYIVSPENKQDLSVKQRWEDFQRGQYKYQIGDFHLNISESGDGDLTCTKEIKYTPQNNDTKTEISGENSYTVKIDEGRTPSLLAALESSNPNNFLNLYSSGEGQLDYQADLQSGNGLKVSLKAYQYADVKYYVSQVGTTVFIQTKDNSFKLTLPSNYNKDQLDNDIQNVVKTKGNPLTSGCTVEVLQQSTIPSFNTLNRGKSININILELSKILGFPLINAEHAKEVFKNLAPPLREEIITNASLTLTTAVKEDAAVREDDATPNNSQSPVSLNNFIPKSRLTDAVFSQLRSTVANQSKSTSTDKLSIISKKQRFTIEQIDGGSPSGNLITCLNTLTSDVERDPILSKYLDNTSQNLFNLSLLNHSSTFIPSKECLQVFEPLFRLLEDKSELHSSIIRKEFSKEDQLFLISLLVNNSIGDGGGEEEKNKKAINSFCNSQFAEAEQIALSCVNDIILAVIQCHQGNTSKYQALRVKFEKLGIPEEKFNKIINLKELQKCETKKNMQKLIEQNINNDFNKRRYDIATVLKNFFIDGQDVSPINWYYSLLQEKIQDVSTYSEVLTKIASARDEYQHEFQGISSFLKELQKDKEGIIAVLRSPDAPASQIDKAALSYLKEIKDSPDQYALLLLTSDAMSYPKSRALMYDILQKAQPANTLLKSLPSNVQQFFKAYEITDLKEQDALQRILALEIDICQNATAQIKDLFSDQLYESRIADLDQDKKVSAATVPNYRLLHLLVSPLQGDDNEINNIIYSQIREFFPYSTQNLLDNPLSTEILEFIQQIKDDNEAITNSASESLKLYCAIQEHTSIGSVKDPSSSSNPAHKKAVLEKIWLSLKSAQFRGSLSVTDFNEATLKLLLQKRRAHSTKEFNVGDILSQIKHLLKPGSGSPEEQKQFVKNLLNLLLPSIDKHSLTKQKISINQVISQLPEIFHSCNISSEILEEIIRESTEELYASKRLKEYQKSLETFENDGQIKKLRKAIQSNNFSKFLRKITEIKATTVSDYPIIKLKSIPELSTLFKMFRENDSQKAITAECERLSKSLSIAQIQKVLSQVQETNQSIQDLGESLKNFSTKLQLSDVIAILNLDETSSLDLTSLLDGATLKNFAELVKSIHEPPSAIQEFLNITSIQDIIKLDSMNTRSIEKKFLDFIETLKSDYPKYYRIFDNLRNYIDKFEPYQEMTLINGLCSALSEGIEKKNLTSLTQTYSTTIQERDSTLSSLSFMEKTKVLYGDPKTVASNIEELNNARIKKNHVKANFLKQLPVPALESLSEQGKKALIYIQTSHSSASQLTTDLKQAASILYTEIANISSANDKKFYELLSQDMLGNTPEAEQIALKIQQVTIDDKVQLSASLQAIERHIGTEIFECANNLLKQERENQVLNRSHGTEIIDLLERCVYESAFSLSTQNVVDYFTYSTTLDKQYINNLNTEHTENAEESKQTLSALHPDIDFITVDDSHLSADNVRALLFKHHVASQYQSFSDSAWHLNKPRNSYIAYCSRIDEICQERDIQLNNPASWAAHPELTFLVERLMHDSYPNTGFYAQPSRPESIKVSDKQKRAMLQTLESNIKTASTIGKNLTSFQKAITNLSEPLSMLIGDNNTTSLDMPLNESLRVLLTYKKNDISYRYPAPLKDMSQLMKYPDQLEGFQQELESLLNRQDANLNLKDIEFILKKMSGNVKEQIDKYNEILGQAQSVVDSNTSDSTTASIGLLDEYYHFELSRTSDRDHNRTEKEEYSISRTMSQLRQVFSQQRFDAAVTELQQGNNPKKGTDAHTLYLTLCETMKSSYSVRDDPVAAIAQHTVDTPGKKPVAKAELRELVIQPLPAIPEKLKAPTVNPISQPRAQKESTSTLTARIEMLFEHIRESTHPNVLLNDLLHNGKPPSDKE